MVRSMVEKKSHLESSRVDVYILNYFFLYLQKFLALPRNGNKQAVLYTYAMFYIYWGYHASKSTKHR